MWVSTALIYSCGVVSSCSSNSIVVVIDVLYVVVVCSWVSFGVYIRHIGMLSACCIEFSLSSKRKDSKV